MPDSLHSHRPKILIVDDDVGTVRLLAQIVKDLGKVYFSTKGSETLGLAITTQPDLILLDIEMPDMNGLNVCALLKNNPVCKDIPLLFVTSHITTEMEARALMAGAIDFIHKPPHAVVVQARVRNYLALKQHADRLRTLSMIDGLTGIANRRTFDIAIADEWRRSCRSAHPLALLMIDVDFFKRYNDTYGHPAGDDCLRAVASTIAANVKRPGELAARYGGEEFAVLLPHCTPEQALGLAEIIRMSVLALQIAHVSADSTGNVSVSIGVGYATLFNQHEDGLEEPWDALSESARMPRASSKLIKAADDALYQAKRKGRNRVEVFLPSSST